MYLFKLINHLKIKKNSVIILTFHFQTYMGSIIHPGDGSGFCYLVSL